MDDENKLSPKKYQAMIRSYLDKTPYVDPDAVVVKKEEYDSCYHSWIAYQGLIQQYDFCSSCGKKRDTIQSVTDCQYWDIDDNGSFS